ncbi:acetylcholinesterase-1-like [Panonychus citri]|uniref:acetylcholinesterase-1-like n=1 Tax=Panonychus citri TaxID=50023 RepID=UPI002307591E|nr:acetylcholinesterase-1-like [Panonychus citri]
MNLLINLNFLIIISSYTFLVNCSTLSRPEVTTEWGKITGFTERIGDKLVDTYLSIPYAEPPVGPNRFKPTVPLQTPWDDPLDATEYSPACPEPYVGNDMKRAGKLIVRSEDCLYLNVWIPQRSSTNSSWLDLTRSSANKMVDSKQGLPVMVYAHGGGLVMLSAGDSKFMDGAQLASTGEFIVVTFNFRLGALGWLYCDDSSISGNMGLYDSLMAIDWVYNNIHAFGGDPKRLTVNGLSSGGNMVTSLFLNGLLNPYISSLIVHSGVISDIYTEPTDLAKRRCDLISLNLSCRLPDQPVDSKVINCLQNTPTVRLLMAQSALAMEKDKLNTKRPEIFFVTTGDSLIPHNITTLYKLRKWSKSVPIFVSLVTDEASVIEHHLPRKGVATFGSYENYLLSVAPTLLPERFSVSPKTVASDLSKVYLSGFKESSLAFMDLSMRRMVGDWYITCPTLHFADEMSSTNPVWLSLFSYTINPARKNLPPLVAGRKYGTRHGIDIFFYFGVPHYEGHGYDDKDRSVSTNAMLIWSRFVREGYANWTPYQVTSKGRVIPYIKELNSNRAIITRINPDRYRCYVWDDLFYNSDNDQEI